MPSQNPDGQYLVVDHWYKTKGTPFTRVYPDLYHKYVGHDDNRDWFMFTQKETRLDVEQVQNSYKPIITHDMHQQGAGGARIFVPPFDDPYDPNIHPILAQGQTTVGQAMAAALVAEGKGGVEWLSRYDMWSPARQYMVYHGQPRILTEIASVQPRRSVRQSARTARRSARRSRAGTSRCRTAKSDMAPARHRRLRRHRRVRRHVARREVPHAVARELLPGPRRLGELRPSRRTRSSCRRRSAIRSRPTRCSTSCSIGDVEIHQAKAPFTAGGKDYAAGSWVIKTAQPYGAFAKTMLERQKYPDLRLFPGGPPKPPYDVTGQTLWMLMGVDVDQIEKPFEAPLELREDAAPVAPAFAADVRRALT